MISNVGGARPHFYDRNPVTRTQQYEGTVAPHAAVNRWTYTVPTGKKAIVNSGTALARRVTAAGTAGEYRAEIDITSLAATATNVALVARRGNVIDDRDTAGYGTQTPLVAGEVVAGATGDGSITGTVWYNVSALITEYDA